jgi:hypothetical protein
MNDQSIVVGDILENSNLENLEVGGRMIIIRGYIRGEGEVTSVNATKAYRGR